jgi:hypothetical protein
MIELSDGLYRYIVYHVVCGLVTLYREMNFGHVD